MDYILQQLQFENFLYLNLAIFVFVLLLNILYWPFRYFKKKKNLKTNSAEISFNQNLLRLKPKREFNFKNFFSKSNLLNYKTYCNFNFIIILISFIGILFVLFSLNMMFNSQPVLINFKPGDNAVWNNSREPIIIEFDRPINPDRVKFNIVPEIPGEIKYEKSIEQLPFTRKLYFYPKESLDPGNRIYLYVNNFFSIYGDHERYGLEAYISSYEPPKIVESSIENNVTEIPINNTFEFTLDREIDEFADINFVFDPIIEFERQIEGKKVKITPKTTFQQSATYKILATRVIKKIDLNSNEIINKSAPETIKELTFTTVTAPNIKSFEPIGQSVFTDAEIKIVFNQSMIPETVNSRLTVTPSFEFATDWSEDKKTLTLKRSKSLEFATNYTVTIAAGANGALDTVLENNFTYNFTTIGPVKVINVSPGNGSYGNGLQTSIRITFDQEVDRTSAQSKFSINPSIQGSFSWDGNTMIYQPSSSLAYYTRYTYTIGKDVKSIKGQSSQNTYSYSFVTITQTVSLGVPLYKQQYSYSCNITAASMILAYKGINKTQSSIYNDPAFPKQNVPHANGVWGDPDIGYVGDLDGPDGYGVHWGPISNYLAGKGVSNRVQRGMSVSQLAKEIEQGRPAIVWVWNGINGSPISWTTPGGRTISGVKGMHSWVVVGYVGTSDNPTSIIINDPWGSRRTLTVSQFNYQWSFYGNTAIIIN